MKTPVADNAILIQRKKSKKRQGLRRLKIAILLILLTVSAAISHRLYNSPQFRIESIEVTGMSRVSKKDVISALSFPKNALLTRVSGQNLSDTISRRSPWIEKVEVTKIWPSTLRLEVVERNPVVRLRMGKVYWLMDSKGVFLRSGIKGKDMALPIFCVEIKPGMPREGAILRTPEQQNAFNALKMLPLGLRKQIKSIRATSVPGLSFELKSGEKIYFGEAKYLAVKNLIIERLTRDIGGKREKIDYLDVRVPSRPAIKLKEG